MSKQIGQVISLRAWSCNPLLQNVQSKSLVSFSVCRHASNLSSDVRSTKRRHVSSLSTGMSSSHVDFTNTQPSQVAGLDRLPTASLLRNIFLGMLLTSPLGSRLGLAILDRLCTTKSAFLSPDRNPILRALVKPLVYDQFCAGTNQPGIHKTRDAIKDMGYSGVILCYGKEIQFSKDHQIESTGKGNTDQSVEIEWWRDGNIETLRMVGEGDWLGIKLTGAGPQVANALMNDEPPPKAFVDAMDAICEEAIARKCRIWVDAEQQVFQTAIDKWTINLMRRYNKDGRAVVYNTVQAYLKNSRSKLEHQLTLAAQENWTLAVKLVRGAYIANDQREKIHDTKPDTDRSYNSIVHDLLSGTMPGFTDQSSMHLFLAGHNKESVSRAWNLIQDLSQYGRLKVLPDFGQLQGMADELGCSLLERCEDLQRQGRERSQIVVVPKVYKCLTWGSIQECMQYLYRRVVENQGSMDRMRDGLTAYYHELRRRVLW